MIELNEDQVNYIEQSLLAKGLNYSPLLEDLLDHVCCQVEEQMAAGISFHAAMELAFVNFGEKGFHNLEKETLLLIHQKQLIMKRLSFLVLAILLLSITFMWAQTQDLSFSKPIPDAEITSGFGMRFHPVKKTQKLHKGVDFKVPLGTPIYATESGKVTDVITHKTGYGKHIVIEHGAEFSSMYAHLLEFKVKKGQQIKKGDLIGLVGSTGASSAPHLHYELRKNGKAIDPEKPIMP